MEKFLRLTTINGLDALPTKLGALVKAKPVEKVDEVRAFEKGDHSQGLVGPGERGQKLEAFDQPFGAAVGDFSGIKVFEKCSKSFSGGPYRDQNIPKTGRQSIYERGAPPKSLYQQVMECWEAGQAQQAGPASDMRDWMFPNKVQTSDTAADQASPGLEAYSLLSEMQKKKRELEQSIIDSCFYGDSEDSLPLEKRVAELEKGYTRFTEGNWANPEQQEQMRKSIQKVFTDPYTRAMVSDNVTKSNTLLTALSQRGGKSIAQKTWQVHEGLNRAADNLREFARKQHPLHVSLWTMELPKAVSRVLFKNWAEEGRSARFEECLKSMGISRYAKISEQALDYMWFDEVDQVKPSTEWLSVAETNLENVAAYLGMKRGIRSMQVEYLMQRWWDRRDLSLVFEEALQKYGIAR